VSAPPAPAPWRGQFTDGQTAVVHALALAVEGGDLVGRDAAGAERLRWPATLVRSRPLGGGDVTLTCALSPDAALTTDADLVAIHLPEANRGRLRPRWPRWQLVLAYGAGVVVVAGLIYSNLDPLARALARRVPPEYEAQLGQGLATLLLRNDCATPEARAVLTRLADRLGGGATEIHILNMGDANAFTLPGGAFMVTRGLIKEAESPDEIAGVLAHELEHVKQRHVMIQVVRNSLLTALWQAAVGDYAGLFVVDPKTAMDIVDLRFSRDAEREADRGARERLDAAHISRAGFRQFFERVRAKTDAIPAWLSNHPSSAERATVMGDDAGALARTPALDNADWATLRNGCTKEGKR
jgi:beta-barrel assembly-enhancing protease